MINMAPFHAMTKQNQVKHSVEISLQVNRMPKVELDPKVRMLMLFHISNFLTGFDVGVGVTSSVSSISEIFSGKWKRINGTNIR